MPEQHGLSGSRHQSGMQNSRGDLKEKVAKLIQRVSAINPSASILAVTKYYSLEQIQMLQALGFKAFGENRLQHAIPIIESGLDAEWHFIGPIQTNKIKKIVQHFDVIQSVSSPKIYEAIVREAEKSKKHVSVFMQVNVTGEDQKFGLSEEELFRFLDKRTPSTYVTIKGLMAMGPLTDQKQKIETCYATVHNIFNALKVSVDTVDTLSMGMTNDFEIALHHGATMIRVGRYFFEGST